MGTYYGGAGDDNVKGIASLKTNVYITGETKSTTAISTAGSHQEINGGGADAFWASFTKDGDRIEGSYLGGALNDNGHAITVSGRGNKVFVAGRTESPGSIATAGAFQDALVGSQDAFVTCIQAELETGLTHSAPSLFEDISLYPNPNSGVFTIRGTTVSPGSVEITLRDFMGRLIFSETLLANRGTLIKNSI